MLSAHLHLFLYATAALYAGMFVYALTRPPNVVNRELALIMLICVAWVYSYSQELNTDKVEVMRAWMRARFLALPFLVPLWLMLAAYLTGQGRRWLSWRTLPALFAIPALTALLATTPRLQKLFRREFVTEGGVPGLLDFESTALANLYTAFVVAGILLGVWILASAFRKHGARRELVLLAVSGIIPLTHCAIIMAPDSRVVMLAPVLLLPMALAMLFASVRYNVLDMAPFVARRQFFEGALEGVIILDTAGRILEYNRAASDGFKLVGLDAGPGVRLGPEWTPEPWGAVFAQDGDAKMVFNCDRPEEDGGMLWYERTRAAVMDRGAQVAWLFTIADITDRVALQERKADEIRRASEAARMRQWHGLLRDLHDGIGPVSTTIGLLAERALRTKDSAGKDDLVRQISDFAENGHVELRTIMNMMEYNRMSWQDIVVEARRFSRLILEPRGIALKVLAEGEPPAEPPPVTGATSLLRIIKEAVHNAAKYSGANEVRVAFAFDADLLRLTVRDNGTWRESEGENETGGRGLRHIRQRVAELRGTMDFHTAPETRLECVLPVALADVNEPPPTQEEENT